MQLLVFDINVSLFLKTAPLCTSQPTKVNCN